MRSEQRALPVCGPAVFSTFTCIAGECPLTCCREWSIAVDDFTMDRWKKCTLDEVLLSSTVERSEDGSRRIRLNPDYRCPWLNETGLCRIVLGLGEEMLSSACALFPRQKKRYPDRIEAALMTGCPAVVDLLWDGADPLPEEEGSFDLRGGELLDDDDRLTLSALRELRRRICEILRTKELTLDEALAVGYFFLREIWEYEPEADRVRELMECMDDRDSLCSLGRRLHEESAASEDWEQENRDLFLDLGENYYRERRYPEILDELIEKARSQSGRSVTEVRERWKALEERNDPILRSVLLADCFGYLLTEQPSLDSLMMNYQWILLRYCGIRQALLLSPVETCMREQVKQIICVLERMTGFSERDIQTTMQAMFDDVRWDAGYAAYLLL